MVDYPLECAVDANILIDFHAGGLLKEVFQLPFKLAAPDVIVAELDEPKGETLLQLGLESRSLSGTQVGQVEAKVRQYDRVSTNDLFALVLAQLLGAVLLTGESQLRQIAKQEGTQVHGTLWLLDWMIELQIIEQAQAAEALGQMLDQGRWLPATECQRRIEQWKR